MKKILCAILSAAMLISLSACGLFPSGTDTDKSGSAGTNTQETDETPETPEEAAARVMNECVDGYLSGMTDEEKAGQIIFARCPESSGASDAAEYHLGGYILFGRDFKNKTADEIIQTVCAYQDAAGADTGIPLLIGTDEEGGTVVRVSSNTNICGEKFLSPQALFKNGGMEEIISDAREKSRLLLALGVNVNLAPVCDVTTDSASYMYPRTFGQDAEAASEYVSSVVETMKSEGEGSVLKHFPGYGDNPNTHTGSAVDERTMDEFESSDFLPFKAGIEAGADAVLVSHNVMTCVDDKNPASLSPAVHEILRDELGFDGVIMTDDLVMDAVSEWSGDYPASVQAVLAGNDMLISSDYKTQYAEVLAAVRDGTIDEATLDTAVRRVLIWKYDLGLIK
ncbi:MAG: glycoside hydrolase family 3 N-terminal domain-containing protein [Oscillospiraceae bacterium]|nr:glycoside hydrolase family 3 N-terminal domain-containing protein [Oscillospiraceae bacterium]